MKQRVYDALRELRGFGYKGSSAVQRRRWHKKEGAPEDGQCQPSEKPRMTEPKYRAPNSTLNRSTKPIARHTPLRNRGGSRFPKRRDRKYTDWIKTLPCVLFAKPDHVCEGPIDPCHVFKTRACGAYDRGEVVPGCRFGMHRRQEGRTAAFMIETGVNVRRVAKELQRWYEEEIEGG